MITRNMSAWLGKSVGVQRRLPAFASTSWGQEGEDLILAGLFGGVIGSRQGFYVDVGAHHPLRLSNTYFFYLRGWRGINIDAMPGSMAEFNQLRPEDINLEIAVSRTAEVKTFYCFENAELNGFGGPIIDARRAAGKDRVIETREVQAMPLSEMLDKHAGDRTIDFMSVDVEGMDMEVLESNNWDKYRPTVVMIEDLESSGIEQLANSPVTRFMLNRGYDILARTRLTSIFAKKDQIVRTAVGPCLREERELGGAAIS